MTIRYDNINTRTGRAGHIRTSSGYHSRISRKVGGQAQEVRKVVVDTATDSTDYTATVEGSAKTITSGVGTTKNLIVLALIDAINGDSDLFSDLYAEEDPDATDALLITRRTLGESFTLTAGANLTASLITAADAGDSIPPGVLAAQDPNDSEGAVLPSATTAVAQVTDCEPTAENTKRYFVAATGDFDGDGIAETIEGEYLSDGSATAAEIVDGLVANLNAHAPALSVLAANSADKLRLTSEVPGVAFEVAAWSDSATATWTLTTVTANVEQALTNRILGPVVLEQRLELPDGGGLVAFGVGDVITLGEVDEIDVLLDAGETVADGDPVYVRCTAGSGEQLGACRNDSDGGDCLLVANARFCSASSTGLDGQNIAGIKIWRA